jgi:hypothetical protein
MRALVLVGGPGSRRKRHLTRLCRRLIGGLRDMPGLGRLGTHRVEAGSGSL